MPRINRTPKECLDMSRAYFHLFSKTGHKPYYDMFWVYKAQAVKDLMVISKRLN